MLLHRPAAKLAITVMTLAASLGCAQSFAATLSPTCKTVMDASDRQYTTPVHLYMARVGSTSESIVTGDAMYIQVKGKWRRSPMAPKGMLEMRRDVVKDAKSFVCQRVRDESVNGESAAVYSMSSETDDGDHSDGQIWISKSRNLPLKSETNLSSDGEKTHTSIRYDYSNVHAPAGAK